MALGLAFGAVAVDPRGVSGFFDLGSVHLIILGWITASILGSLYMPAWPRDREQERTLLKGFDGMGAP